MLFDKFIASRMYTETLCKPLKVEDFVPQSAEYTSPPKWHLAHTSWFFEEMVLKKYLPDYKVFDPHYAFLFNSYYQGLGERAERTQRGLITRPSVEEVFQYREYVNMHIEKLLHSNACNQSDVSNTSIESLITLGIQHEQQHQELLITDIKYTLSLNPISPIYDDLCLINDKNSKPSNEWIKIKEGIYTIGHHGEDFCFDNELGHHKVYLHDCQISNNLVTNKEYIEFIEAGGYQQFTHWLDEGWQWALRDKIEHPLYWRHIDGHWYNYTLAGLQKIDPNALLCHISFYEANAYASWRGARLPTEFEWEAASAQLDWGKRWEWTLSAYLPYPKFSVNPGAVGEYNGKFMVNQMVLRGASVATSKGHSRNTYRNFFHPHFQWQFTGIRLVQD